MVLDKLHRKFLAACIHVDKGPTKENILKYALKYYLTKCYDRYGLCASIDKAIMAKLSINQDKVKNVRKIEFELFNRGTAINFGAYSCLPYWWPLTDWKSRYRYMRWLIKQYK